MKPIKEVEQPEQGEKMWSKGFPALDGDYLCRVDKFDKSPTPIRIESHRSDTFASVYEFGCADDLRREYESETDYEYLGPFTASDTEELLALREAATKVLAQLETAVKVGNLSAYSLIQSAVAQLRKALQKE